MYRFKCKECGNYFETYRKKAIYCSIDCCHRNRKLECLKIWKVGHKKCSKCGEEKDLEEFYSEGRKVNGKVSRCKACVIEDRKKYYKSHIIETWVNKTILYHKKKGHFIGLSKQELYEMREKAIKCEMCGVEFSLADGNGTNNAESPSIDRIDNNEGLIKENVWTICNRCNRGKQEMSILQYVNYCKDVIKTCRL